MINNLGESNFNGIGRAPIKKASRFAWGFFYGVGLSAVALFCFLQSVSLALEELKTLLAKSNRSFNNASIPHAIPPYGRPTQEGIMY